MYVPFNLHQIPTVDDSTPIFAAWHPNTFPVSKHSVRMKLAEAAAVVAQVWWTYLDHLRSILFDLPNHSVVILCLYLGTLWSCFMSVSQFPEALWCQAFNQVPVCDFKVHSSMSETFFGTTSQDDFAMGPPLLNGGNSEGVVCGFMYPVWENDSVQFDQYPCMLNLSKDRLDLLSKDPEWSAVFIPLLMLAVHIAKNERTEYMLNERIETAKCFTKLNLI